MIVKVSCFTLKKNKHMQHAIQCGNFCKAIIFIVDFSDTFHCTSSHFRKFWCTNSKKKKNIHHTHTENKSVCMWGGYHPLNLTFYIDKIELDFSGFGGHALSSETSTNAVRPNRKWKMHYGDVQTESTYEQKRNNLSTAIYRRFIDPAI